MSDAAPVKNVRLPGSGMSRKGGSFLTLTRVASRLWLGDDHLLQVDSTGGYSEQYRRFYFRDIQAFSLHKTKEWFAVNLILGVVTGLFLLWALIVENTGGKITLGIISATLGIFLLVNVLRGSTCNCQIKTAVHLEELPSLRRRRNAEKVLARLRPLIEAAQGSAKETVALDYAALLSKANAQPAAPGQFSRVADPTVSPYESRAHSILFIALLVDASTNSLNIILPGIPAVVASAITGALLAGAVIVALVKQHHTDLAAGIRILTWVAAAFVALGYLAGYVIMIVLTEGQHLDGTQWGYLKALADLQPFETPWWLAVLSIGAAGAALLGVTGLSLLRQHRRHQTTSNDATSPPALP